MFVIKYCRCGKEFETDIVKKIYCTAICQAKYCQIDAWNKTKLDYKFRCRKLRDMAKFRAKISALPFNLTIEYLINLWELQDGRCAISGRCFDLSRPSENETVKANAPSLDRIEPKKGYVQDNVRFVCYQVNTALNEYGEEELLKLCKDIMNFNKVPVS